MGCCSSQPDSPTNRNLVSNPAAAAASKPAAAASTAAAGNNSTANAKESQIALAFKAKRANVFTASVDTDTRRAFHAKNIPKTPKQELAIRKLIFHVMISLDWSC
jgi:hypothetical protein